MVEHFNGEREREGGGEGQMRSPGSAYLRFEPWLPP